jgi:hypothetical protein
MNVMGRNHEAGRSDPAGFMAWRCLGFVLATMTEGGRLAWRTAAPQRHVE